MKSSSGFFRRRKKYTKCETVHTTGTIVCVYRKGSISYRKCIRVLLCNWKIPPPVNHNSQIFRSNSPPTTIHHWLTRTAASSISSVVPDNLTSQLLYFYCNCENVVLLKALCCISCLRSILYYHINNRRGARTQVLQQSALLLLTGFICDIMDKTNLSAMSITEMETNRGKRSISCDYYRYRIDHYLRDGDISWRCTQKRCKARIRTDEALTEVLQRKNEHCHAADERKTERQILRVRSKRKAVQDAHEKPSKIMCSELESVQKQFLHPTDLKSVAQAMYRERRKHGLLPANSLTVKIPLSKHGVDARTSSAGTDSSEANSHTNSTIKAKAIPRPPLPKIIKIEPIDVDEFFEDNEAAFGWVLLLFNKFY